MLSVTMTPTTVSERLAEGRVDRDRFYRALLYVHEDGRH